MRDDDRVLEEQVRAALRDRAARVPVPTRRFGPGSLGVMSIPPAPERPRRSALVAVVIVVVVVFGCVVVAASQREGGGTRVQSGATSPTSTSSTTSSVP